MSKSARLPPFNHFATRLQSIAKAALWGQAASLKQTSGHFIFRSHLVRRGLAFQGRPAWKQRKSRPFFRL